MSNIPNFVTRKKKKKRKKEKRRGHIIKCSLTELGRAGRENIWHSVMEVRHDLGPNIFPSGPPTQSISTYYVKKMCREYIDHAEFTITDKFLVWQKQKIFC